MNSEMFDPLVDAAFAALVVVGPPALFVLFVLKGAIVGKPFPTSVFLPGYILAVSARDVEIVALVLVASVGYVCGQLLVYFGSRRAGPGFVESLPYARVSERRRRRSEALFARYGGAGIFITNLVPYLGSFILVPAGVARYPAGKVVAYAFVSTVLNYVVIVALALGLVRLLF